jgi:hypothetical protein
MPPRALFTPHERGKNLGTPGDAELQRQIVRDALTLLETAREPFTTVDWTPPAWRVRTARPHRSAPDDRDLPRVSGEKMQGKSPFRGTFDDNVFRGTFDTGR